MDKSNKILLKALLNLEFSIGKTQKIFDTHKSFISFEFNFQNIYDLFEVIISAFNIPDTNYDKLYDILNNLYNCLISSDKAINLIENLII